MNLFYKALTDIFRQKNFQYPQWQKLWAIPVQDVLNDANQFIPSTAGLLTNDIVPITGKYWRVIETPNNKRLYKVDPIDDAAGPCSLITVSGYIPFAATYLTDRFTTMKYYKYILLIQINQDYFIIGSPDDGVQFKSGRDSGDNPRTVPGVSFQFTLKTKDAPMRYSGALPE